MRRVYMKYYVPSPTAGIMIPFLRYNSSCPSDTLMFRTPRWEVKMFVESVVMISAEADIHL